MTSVLPNATPYELGCRPSPSVPAETVIADGWCTYLLFLAVSQDLDSNGKLTDMGVAVLRCDNCATSRFGYPNDEGFAEHPLYALCRNITSPAIQIDDSDWLRSTRDQMRGSAERIWGDQYKPTTTVLSHFLLPLKEATFECIAESLTVECYCDSYDAAFAHVKQRLAEN